MKNNVMKKNICKTIAGLMSVAMILGNTGLYAKADTSALSMINSFLDDAKSNSTENVYVITGADGTPTKVMDSKNSSKAEEIDDIESLPIKIKATYTLDGEEIDASKIEGASGKLTIRYDYENTEETTVKIGNTEEKVHVPFTVATGMVVDRNEFKDIKVSNGKTVSDGDKILVVGMAYPSLADDLKITDSELKLYDYVEIEATVEDAKWTNVYTVVTNTAFSALGEDMGSTIDTSSLTNLVEGIEQLSEGSKQLADGLTSLDESTTTLKNGVSSLNSGLATLNASSTKLNAGADQVFNSLLNTANTTIAQSGASLPALTKDNYSLVLSGAIKSLTAKGDAKSAASLTALKGQLDSFNTFYQGVYAYTAGVDSAYAGSKKLNSSMPALKEGVTALKDGASSLNDGMNELSEKTVGKLSSDEGEGAVDVYTRFKAISEVSSDYSSYADKDDSEDGYVCFIYKMKKN